MQRWKLYVMIIFTGLSLSTAYSDESILKENDADTRIVDPMTPTNNNSSVQYLLYTPKNPTKACYIEPNVSEFNKCSFNSSYETKFVIHGYMTKLIPGNLMEIIKNTLLEYDKYNVIIVNWTKYNQQNYVEDTVNAYIVGTDVANMINFITAHTNASALSFHLIGHSLGAHISGIAGKHVHRLGRITGMDPAGPLFEDNSAFKGLSSNDAVLVDVMHTSTTRYGKGYGDSYPMGWINFYPNGGQNQPMCQIGNTYLDSNGEAQKITTFADQASCDHDSSLTYFNSSIFACTYLSTQCRNYETFEIGQCKSGTHQTSRMGFHCTIVPGLKNHSTFYLDTSGTSPFC